MIEQIINLDQELLLYLNSINSPFWDKFMYTITQTKTWLPFYAIILCYIIFTFKKKSWTIVLTIAIVVGLSDFTASTIFKKSVKRFRPSHEPELREQVHLVNDYKGGKYGFFSSHAATTFSFAFFLLFIYKKRNRIFYTIPFWAFIISYSRIYLGVHYPLDILCGAICGALYAIAGYKVLAKTKFIEF